MHVRLLVLKLSVTCCCNYQVILGIYWWLHISKTYYSAVILNYTSQLRIDLGLSVQEPPSQSHWFCARKSCHADLRAVNLAQPQTTSWEVKCFYIILSFPTTCHSSKIKKVNPIIFLYLREYKNCRQVSGEKILFSFLIPPLSLLHII